MRPSYPDARGAHLRSRNTVGSSAAAPPWRCLSRQKSPEIFEAFARSPSGCRNDQYRIVGKSDQFADLLQEHGEIFPGNLGTFSCHFLDIQNAMIDSKEEENEIISYFSPKIDPARG
jgi:hypothetical protein